MPDGAAVGSAQQATGLPGKCLSAGIAAVQYFSVIQVEVLTIHLSQTMHKARCIGRGNANKPTKFCSCRETHFLNAVGY